MYYNKSMKRVDILKGIEQILVQKAYETGHISHRADSDWQKQADGSWKPYKGQSTQSIPQTQKPIENTEYGEITEEDLVETLEEDSNDWEEEDTVEAVHDSLKDAVLDRWSSIYVQKSAIRDMRSIPTTKNMGF